MKRRPGYFSSRVADRLERVLGAALLDRVGANRADEVERLQLAADHLGQRLAGLAQGEVERRALVGPAPVQRARSRGPAARRRRGRASRSARRARRGCAGPLRSWTGSGVAVGDVVEVVVDDVLAAALLAAAVQRDQRRGASEAGVEGAVEIGQLVGVDLDRELGDASKRAMAAESNRRGAPLRSAAHGLDSTTIEVGVARGGDRRRLVRRSQALRPPAASRASARPPGGRSAGSRSRCVAALRDLGAIAAATTRVLFTTVYLIERSLSLDNVFVFLLLFTYFQVPPRAPAAADHPRDHLRAADARRWRSSAGSSCSIASTS